MVKKINFILFITILGLTKLQAQVTFRPGIHAGVNLSKLTNSELGSKADFYIGGFGALKLSNFYTLQPELTYSRQGGKGTESMGTTSNYDPITNSYTTINQSGTVNATLQYISALTISKFNFNEKVYVLVGPFADILIADNFKVEPKENERNFHKGEDIDFGLVGGFGYSLKNGVSFETRIKKGLITSYYNDYEYSDNSNNLVFQFGATYTFGKK